MDGEQRRNYDREIPELIRQGLLKQNDLGEEFSRNAFDRSNDGNDDDNDDDGLDNDEPEPMSERKQALVNRYPPAIKRILESDDEDAYDALMGLSERMRRLNEEENRSRSTAISTSDRCPPVEPIREKGENRRRLLATMNDPSLSQNAREAAKRDLVQEQKRFYDYMREMHIPLNPLEGVYDVTNRQSPSDPVDIPWTAGQTTRGEKILAMRGIGTIGIMAQPSPSLMGKVLTSTHFIIELEGEANPIAIASETRVGIEAARAYHNLPEDQKCDISSVNKSYTKMEKYNFGRIKGVARYGVQKSSRFVWTAVLIEYFGEDRVTDRLINRSQLRQAVGYPEADHRIDEFLVKVGEEPDLPKKLLYQQQENRLLLPSGMRDTRRPSERYDLRTRAYEYPRSRTGHPRMLPEEEEDTGYDLDGRGSSYVNRSRVPDREQVRSSNGLRDHTHSRGRRATSTRPRSPGLTSVPTAPPVQHPSRASTTYTPPGTTSEEQHGVGAVANHQPVTQAQFIAMMEAQHQMQHDMQLMMRSMQSMQLTNRQNGMPQLSASTA